VPFPPGEWGRSLRSLRGGVKPHGIHYYVYMFLWMMKVEKEEGAIIM